MLEFKAMTNLEKFIPKERGARLFETTSVASRMIVERINLENMGLELIDLPLCTEKEAQVIEEFLPRAREGFSLSLKSGRVLASETRKLLEQTTPLVINTLLGNIKLEEHQNTLPEYGHTLATIAYLLELKHVSFFNFSDPPKDVDYDLGFLESYWNFNTFSVDHIWSIMIEIENITRAALYKEGNMPIADLIKAGHFYAAGKEISKIFTV